MTRLPIPGKDPGTWGDILNDFLNQSHKTDGSLKNGVVGSAQLQDNAVTETILSGAVQTKLNQTAPVTKVNNQTGDITLTKTDIGLSNVDNTADTAKPISTVQQAALDLKADTTALAAKLNTADLDAQTAAKITTDGTATQVALSSTYVTRAITVGVGRDHATIQEAIDNAGDTSDSPVTIYVYPGTYARFSMVGWPYATTGSNVILCRHLSIIGVNAVPGDVIVKDDTGDYRTPPAEISTVGTIENISFISTHTTPFSDPVEAARTRRAYAVHMEFGPQDVTFVNCEFISYHAPGVGLGMYSGEKVRFHRCRLQSFADGTFGGLLNYGGLFAHSSAYDNVIGQYLELRDTEVSSQNGDRAIWLGVAGNFVNSEMVVSAVGVNAYCPTATPVVRDAQITLTPGSRNNNSAALTPAAAPAQIVGLSLPGATTDYLITPDSATLDITGDIDLIWHGSLTTWAKGSMQGLISKYTTSNNQRSYGLSVSDVGRLYLTWTRDGLGATLTGVTSTAAIPTANGSPVWLRATLDVDNGAGGNSVKFYTSADGATWTQLGSTVTTAGVTNIFAGTAPLTVGLWVTYPSAGIMRRAIVKNGIDGTVVADWDGRTPSTLYRDSAGNRWAIVGGGSARVAA